jgi:protein ImuA
MEGSKANIIAQLKKNILLLHGFKPASSDMDMQEGLHFIQDAFPNSRFPTGVIHEFFCNNAEEVSASYGFTSGLLSSLMQNGEISLWITSHQKIFPPALKQFGINPNKMIFIHLKTEKEKLWAIEEALKCDGVSSVIGEINEISFTESRRLQLITERSKVNGFIIRRNPKNLSTASVTRWRIRPIPSCLQNAGVSSLSRPGLSAVNKLSVAALNITQNNFFETDTKGMPGIGFPKWDVALLKVRNGKPGSWIMQWRNGKFELVNEQELLIQEEQRKIG